MASNNSKFFDSLEVQLTQAFARHSMPRRLKLLEACWQACEPAVEVYMAAGKLTTERAYLDAVWFEELTDADRRTTEAQDAYICGELQLDPPGESTESFVKAVDRLRALALLTSEC